MNEEKDTKIPPFPYHPIRRAREWWNLSELTGNPVFWTMLMILVTLGLAFILYITVLGMSE